MDLDQVEILGNVTMYDNKITVSKRVRRMFKMKNGDHLTWLVNKKGELVLTKSSINRFSAIIY